MRFVTLTLPATLFFVGCASESPLPAPPTPVATTLPVYSPAAEVRPPRQSILLDFEDDTDAVFVTARGGSSLIDTSVGGAQRSSASYSVPRGAGPLEIKLATLLSGRAFPGNWSLLAVQVMTQNTGAVTLTYWANGRAVSDRTVRVVAGHWTLLALDIATFDTFADDARLIIAPALAAGDIRVDNLVLIDNQAVLVPRDEQQMPHTWEIRRRGLDYTLDAMPRFRTTINTAGGARLEEASPLRARFANVDKTASVTIYSDGRAFWDGVYRPIHDLGRANALLKAQHDSPGEIIVPEEMGRVVRNSPGDANNDGYNESRGAYQLLANGPRLEIRIAPRSASLLEPILEIQGLPPGRLLVTMEGELIERHTRMQDGTTLIQLPGHLHRPTTVNIRIQ